MIEIIAELAQGYEGKPEQSHLLVRAAARAGADAAKMQLVYADELCTPDYKDCNLFQAIEMSDSVWIELARAARDAGCELHVDIFGPRSLALAEAMEVGAVKIHGTDMANRQLLQAVAESTVETVMVGTGGGFRSEIADAVRIFSSKKLVLLFGFQGYPTPTGTNQIDRVRAFADEYRDRPNLSVGFADHAAPESPLATALSAAAVGAGATVIEKHLTLGRIMKLEDHEAALNPDQFAEFVEIIRACGAAMGATSGADDFGMSPEELHYRGWTRKHVVATRPIRAGETISPDAVALKRTSAKDAITDAAAVYERVAARAIKAGAPIVASDIREATR